MKLIIVLLLAPSLCFSLNVYRGIWKTKYVHLTFDDIALRSDTNKILDIIKDWNKRNTENKIQATFFLCGDTVFPQRAKTLNRIITEGHTLGNHSLHHNKFTDENYSLETTYNNLKKSNGIIDKCLGYNYPWKYYRPPFGVRGRNYRLAVKQLNGIIVEWHVTSDDYFRRPVNAKKKILNHYRVGYGGIVIMHDKYAPNFLDELLQDSKQYNVNYVNIERMLSIATNKTMY